MDEKQLLEKFNNLETRNFAFNQIVRAYQEKVYWHVRKMVYEHDDANDITQDVFVKVWKNLTKFNQNSSLYTWIYRIATNECLNFLKKKKRKFFGSGGSEINDELINKLTASSQISGDDVQIKLQKAIATLPNKQRAIFNMKYFDDMQYNQISEVLGTSVGALKASYHHAVKKIQSFLNED